MSSFFDLLKACLMSAPALEYPDCRQAFNLETDAFLQELGTPSRRDAHGKSRIITYACRSLQPNGQYI